MKFLIFLVLSAGLSAFSEVCEAKQASDQTCQSFQIAVIDRTSSETKEIIDAVLAIQRAWIISPSEPLAEERRENGFLLVPMSSDYVMDLLEQKNGSIVSVCQGNAVVGYILLTEVSEFEELCQEGIGYLESPWGQEKWETLLSNHSLGYIEQIAVHPDFVRKGIGKLLLEASQKIKPEGLLADVFIDPLANRASLHFFSSQGFSRVAILHQSSRANRNFPYPHRSQVFLWQKAPDS